jgi:hypothetical protein
MIIFIIWLFLCMTGLLGPVGNCAHLSELILGAIIGYAPVWWKQSRGKKSRYPF